MQEAGKLATPEYDHFLVCLRKMSWIVWPRVCHRRAVLYCKLQYNIYVASSMINLRLAAALAKVLKMQHF